MAVISWPAPDEMPARRFAKPVRRLCSALRRKRYVLALENVPSFGRPPTVHHGIPHGQLRLAPDYEALFDFLKTLVEALDSRSETIGDSIICCSIDELAPRRPLSDDRQALDCVAKVNDNCRSLLDDWRHKHKTVDIRITEKIPREDYQLPRFSPMNIVSMMRRARSFVAIKRLANTSAKSLLPGLRPRSVASTHVDPFVTRVQKRIGKDLIEAEGGYYWLLPQVRDRYYARLSDETSHEIIGKLLTSSPDVFSNTSLQLTTLQLYLLSLYHKALARYYYSDLFLASHDVYPLLEFMYHQISALRYLCKPSQILDMSRRGGAIPSEDDLLVWARSAESGADYNLFTRRGHRRVLHNLFEDPDACDTLRLAEIESLQLTLRREREYFLSRMAPSTLSAWVAFIVSDDLDRLRWPSLSFSEDKSTRRCPDAHSIPGNAPSDLKQRLEKQRSELARTLCDLQASVLIESTEYAMCVKLRECQLTYLNLNGWFGRLPGRSLSEDFSQLFNTKATIPFFRDEEFRELTAKVCCWLKGVDTLLDGDIDRDVLDALRYAVDIATCLRGMMRLSQASTILSNVLRAVRRLEGEVLVRPSEALRNVYLRDLRRLRLKALFRKADLLLARITPRLMRLEGESVEPNALTELTKVRKLCDRGLEVVRTALPNKVGDYFQYRCTFHSIRARARYLTGNSGDEPLEELAQAGGGIGRDTGASRTSLAIRDLYLAECLLLRAREAIVEAIRKTQVPADVSQVPPHEKPSNGVPPKNSVLVIWPGLTVMLKLP